MRNKTLRTFHTILRVVDRVFVGFATLEERPQYNENFVVTGSTFICKNKKMIPPVVGEVDIHRHAPLKDVCGRILTGKFKELSRKKSEEVIIRHFSKPQAAIEVENEAVLETV